MKMEQIECSETSAYINQTPGNHPKENTQHCEHGESLKSRRLKKAYNADLWKLKTQNNTVKNKPKTRTQCTEEKEEAELQIRSFPLIDASRVASNTEHDTAPDQIQADTSTVFAPVFSVRYSTSVNLFHVQQPHQGLLAIILIAAVSA